MSNTKVLTLSLQKKWFDLIERGIKKEEYREIKSRYLDMFCKKIEPKIIENFYPNHSNDFSVGFHLLWPEELSKKFDTLVFTLGYSKSTNNKLRLTFKNPKVRIDYGKTEWGAEPNKKYFVITWEEK